MKKTILSPTRTISRRGSSRAVVRRSGLNTMEHLKAKALLLRHLERDLDPASQHVLLICDEIVERIEYLADASY